MIETIKQNKTIVISSIVVFAIMIGSYLLISMSGEKPAPKENPEVIITDLTLIGDTPQYTAKAFIIAAGTMGNIEVEVSADRLEDGTVELANSDRRVASYQLAQNAVIPGSDLKNDGIPAYADRYANSLVSPVFYSVPEDSVKVSEPMNERTIEVVSELGLSTYKAVDVLVDFDSIRTIYDRVRDASWDGTYTRIDNKQQVREAKMTLVEVDGLWLVYAIENVEYELNARLSTWSGVGKETIDVNLNQENGIIKIEGYEPLDLGGN